MNTLTCTRCGFRFRNRAFGGINTTLILSNNRTNCPRCGNIFNIPDGSYSFDDKGDATFRGAVSVLREGNYSEAEFRQLLSLVKQAQATESLRDDFTTHANAIAPGLGDNLEAYFKSRQYTMAALAILISVIVFLAPYLKSEVPNTPIINNTYNITSSDISSANKIGGAQRKPNIAPGKPGSNLTPPLSKKARRKRRK